MKIKPMTMLEWKELEGIGMEPTPRTRELLRKTRREDSHPDNYNGPCECQTCMSYADV